MVTDAFSAVAKGCEKFKKIKSMTIKSKHLSYNYTTTLSLLLFKFPHSGFHLFSLSV